MPNSPFRLAPRGLSSASRLSAARFANRVAAIYRQRLHEGIDHIAVVGDLNVATAWRRNRPTAIQALRLSSRGSAERETDLHLHDLRHYANTLAASAGASTKELMARLGHAAPSAALRYQHATAERDRVIVDRINDLIADTSSRVELRVLRGGA